MRSYLAEQDFASYTREQKNDSTAKSSAEGKMKRIIAMLLCIVALTGILSGCNSQDSTSTPNANTETNGDSDTGFEQTGEETATDLPESTDSSSEDSTQDEDTSLSIDFEAAFAQFEPDAVMLRVGDLDVTWGEMFFYLRGNINDMLSSMGGAFDWSETLFEDYTYADFVLMSAIENAQVYKTIEYGANLSGVQLSADDIEMLQTEFEQTAVYYGGEDELLRLLWEESGCHDRELLDYFLCIGFLESLLFSELYGVGGANLSDEQAAELTESGGYLMAKHILVSKPEDGESSDDTALSAAEDLLVRLNSFAGDDFAAFFDELMFTYSEDPGVVSYPQGYLFQYGDMLSEFYDACIALDIGEHSGVIESMYGYHIIYRLPIDFDVTPLSFAMYGDSRTLRAVAAYSLYNIQLQEWHDDLVLEYAPEYESFDFEEVFAFR